MIRKSPLGILVFCLALLISCFGSEMTLSLEEKIEWADIVVIGSVTDVVLGEITPDSNGHDKQETFISIKINECLLGNDLGVIKIEADSYSYTEYGVIHGSTAGFSNFSLEKGNQYIAYLKKVGNQYKLVANSNQSLEFIDAQSDKANDVGQTSSMVALDQKLKEIKKLSLEKKKRLSEKKEEQVIAK